MLAEFETKTAYPIFARVCLRCGRPIGGYGFYTLYGALYSGANGAAKKIHGCGDPVHYRCPAPRTGTRRAEYHADIERPGAHGSAHLRLVSTGIQYNVRTGRYNARVNKKRLGSHSTIEAAQAAIEKYKTTLRSKAI